MVKQLRVGVLASGGGTDLQSIIDASEKDMINAEVVVVLSDKKTAYALQRAKNHKIPNYFVDPKGKTREEHEAEMTKKLLDAKVDLVVEAGYMRMLTPGFVKRLSTVRPWPFFSGSALCIFSVFTDFSVSTGSSVSTSLENKSVVSGLFDIQILHKMSYD